MSESKVEEFMKKHPPWAYAGIHPIRLAKNLSEEEQQAQMQSDADTEEDRITP